MEYCNHCTVAESKHKNFDIKALSILTSLLQCRGIGRQQKTGRQTGIPCMLTTCAPLVIQMREAGC